MAPRLCLAIEVTEVVADVLDFFQLVALLVRHVEGDFGDIDEEDKQANESAITSGGWIYSAYRAGISEKVYIVTNDMRTTTFVMLARERE
jgi:hypothetical protein